MFSLSLCDSVAEFIFQYLLGMKGAIYYVKTIFKQIKPERKPQ
jgi:hypothetical protein